MEKMKNGTCRGFKVRLAVVMTVALIVLSAVVAVVVAHGASYDMAFVPVQIYHPDLDSGFTLTNSVNSTVYGSSSYTTLMVETSGGDITTSSYNGVTAYGITPNDSQAAPSVSISFKVNSSAGIDQCMEGSSQWMLCDDSWGTYENQKVNGVTTGVVKSGALIVQTSLDGKTWSDDNKAKYTNGLYTTDYFTHHGRETKTIYTPSGSDVNRGVYIRVLYAYEVYDYVSCSHPTKFLWITTGHKHKNDNVYHNYVECFTFYLCNNSPEAVTFHNLSADDKFPEKMLDEDGNAIEAYKQSETMLSGAGTVTGFKLDKSKNAAASVEVLRNGTKIGIPSDQKFVDDGRYDICVTTALGVTKKTTLYVDKSSDEESLATYFGEGFLHGSKRIYSDGELPVFEGGKTYFSLREVSEYLLPLSGTIKNKTTGSTITIDSSRAPQNGTILSAGEYEATFTTNPLFDTDKASGDARVFTFRFHVIEQGSAPGPVLNRKNLMSYATSSVSDAYPLYYGITFQSAGKGAITLAFADYSSALEYAYNYEKGVVEEQADGSFLYTGSLNITGRKRAYDDTWDLTDAIYHFAEQAVNCEYFDMSAEHSYLSLDEQLLESVDNLRTLELTRSVVVFASDEHRNALMTRDALPVIHPKQHAYLTLEGETVLVPNDFTFIKDANGYDSQNVTVLDCTGKAFDIEYNRGAGEQLLEKGCKTGVITIIEETVYGDTTTYQALFVEEGVNASTVRLEVELNGESKSFSVSQKEQGLVLEANIFTLASVVDTLDPYSIIKVVKDGKTQEEQVFCIHDMKEITFGQVGEYHFSCVNRLGFSFDFSVAINSPSDIVLEFKGEGADGLSPIITHYQDNYVTLPTLSRYGYEFRGFMAPNGELYNHSISEILFKGKTLLEPVWEAKEFFVSFDNGVEPLCVRFGEEYTLPLPTLDAGYSFVEWTCDNVPVQNNRIAILSEGNVNLAAKVEKTHAVVSFDTQGGSALSSMLCSLDEVLELPTPVREGYRFAGWSVNGESLGSELAVSSLDDVVLTASWEKSTDPLAISAVVVSSLLFAVGAFLLVKYFARRKGV